MTFRIGQKVCCISNGCDTRWRGLHKPVVDEVYTIRAMRLSRDLPSLGYLSCLLNEISNPINPHSGQEFGFLCSRFRPVVERKTSIEIFQKMLNPSPEKVMDDLVFDTLADIYLSHKQWTS
jgi:hypothetical protein